MATQNTHLVEGQPIDRPPLFDCTNYELWSTKMATFIKAYDYEVWDVIMDGPFVPTKSSNARRKKSAKARSELSMEEKRKVQVNFKAINVLHCALSQSDFDQISTCSNAKEIWEKLKKDYSTPKVEASKAKVETNLCLMAKEDEIEVISNCPIVHYDNDDMQYDYDNLCDEFDKLILKYKVLKKKANALHDDLEKIKVEFQIVFDDRNMLQVELEHARNDYDALKLDLESKSKALQETLVENSTLKLTIDELSKLNLKNDVGNACHKCSHHASHVHCYACGRRGHLSYDCYHKGGNHPRTKMIWVPKGSHVLTNPRGPIKVWVPKIQT
ncbi:hypothetical protein CCACVL1_27438 [Corchorus capsularis]|uniref:CCHC-type domain-containing protein n=1 Tax=Corchorus capsularis TaxID=210143 RepID=A0A1R3GAA0_COCAP|nr:hypothetical protein CCACVL1_27438 [Corchorus capsularis]